MITASHNLNESLNARFTSLQYLRGEAQIYQAHQVFLSQAIKIEEKDKHYIELLSIRNHVIQDIRQNKNLSMRELAFIFNISSSRIETILNMKSEEAARLEKALTQPNVIKCSMCNNSMAVPQKDESKWNKKRYCRECRKTPEYYRETVLRSVELL